MTTLIIEKTSGDIVRKYVCDKTTAYYELERLKHNHELINTSHGYWENDSIEVIMYE